MTRETKIGLLMGLGFIVVFAVLLLQTGPKPRPGGDLPMMMSQYGNSAASRPESLARLPEPVISQRPATQPAGSGRHAASGSLAEASEAWEMTLPRPPILGERPDSGDLGPGGSAMTDDLTARSRTQPGTIEITPTRIAPTNDVTPSVRPDNPTSSPLPPVPAAQPKVTPAAGSPGGDSPVQNDVDVPDVYVVQKGDSLVKIAKKHYNNSSTPVLDFLLRSNRGKLRGRDYVVEGQKLMIPVLPVSLGGAVRDMVAAGPASDRIEDADPAPSTRSSTAFRPLSSERTAPPASAIVKLEQDRTAPDSTLAKRSTPSPDPSTSHRVGENQTSRKAAGEAGESPSVSPASDDARRRTADERSTAGTEPKQSARDKRPPAAEKSDEDAYRWYTVRPKDTLASIANKELGDRDNWEDIVKLNKSLRPTKMKVGDKIRLPKRKSASESAGSSKRSST